MTNEEAKLLLDKFNTGQASEQEAALLQYWYIYEATKAEAEITDSQVEDILAKTRFEVLQHAHPLKIRLWPRFTAVAAVVLLVGMGLWFYRAGIMGLFGNHRHLQYANDISPGKNSATLTFANGKTIRLSDAKHGVIIDAGKLSYNDGTRIKNSAIDLDQSGLDQHAGIADKGSILTAATPRGGTYQVVLPDGSKVWLNAASSLRFPAAFVKRDNRVVELDGEAYFEVYPDKKHPFVVKTNKQEVRVLGTRFNINTYSNEPVVKTTLLEGSVSIKVGHIAENAIEFKNETILKPGQQSIFSGKTLNVVEVDVENEIDWKNGDFVLRKEKLESIMRKIARWYDVTVVYQDDAPLNLAFGGVVSRANHISALLQLMESTGKVHFSIKGKVVTVSK